ncbi:MAG: hypothetical protein ABSE74_04830 [Methanoregula sp.]|jgi:hypothetical protein
MEDLTLTVKKRAFPSLGRARVSVVVLEKLGVDERGDLDVGTTGKDRWITVAAYSDSTVGEGIIRLSEDDLAALGVDDGTGVIVKKALPLSDQVRATAHAAVGQVAGGIEGIRGRIAQTFEPVTAKAQVAVQDAYFRVSKELPTKDDISKTIDVAKKKIAPNFAPDDAGALLTLLYENGGAIRAIKIPAGKETTVAALGLPEGVAAIAFRREGAGLVVPVSDSTIRSGDQLFLIGDEHLLAPAIQKLGK